MLSVAYSQCDDYNQFQCSNSDGCNWVEDFNYYSCGNFNQSECNQYESCLWTLQYGGSYGQWYYGCSGNYEVNNSYCENFEEPEPPICSDLDTEDECNHPFHGDGCEWIPDLEYEGCLTLNESSCNIDNGCNWIEDIQYGNCSSLNEASCDANPECYYDCEFYHGSCAGCCWGTCYGGSYIISDNSYCSGDVDNGYCTEEYDIGDVNLDGTINVIDIVELVTIILNGEYSISGDVNQDGANNITDVISLVNIVLEPN